MYNNVTYADEFWSGCNLIVNMMIQLPLRGHVAQFVNSLVLLMLRVHSIS